MAGRPPKEKSFANMLSIAIMEAGIAPGTTKLRDVANKLVEQAIAGEGWAVREIADRLDGKVPQAHIGGEEDDPAIKIGIIERHIVKAPPQN